MGACSFCSKQHTPIKYGQDCPALPPLPPTDAGSFMRSWDDRLWLFQRRWEPAGDVRATLMIIHGTVDHSGVYSALGQALASEGVAVFATDMRGWGLSDGESMYFHDVDTFVADVDAAYKKIHEDPRYACVKPRFLLGKSIGGLVAALSVARHPRHFTGLLGLSGSYQLGPALAPSGVVRLILRCLNCAVPKLPVRRPFDPELIVSDADALEKWRADPLCSKDKLRLGYLSEILRCKDELPAQVPGFDIPMLMMWGSGDKVVSLAGHELMVNGSAGTDKKLIVYDGGFHNLLAEPSLKDRVIGDIRSWILERSC